MMQFVNNFNLINLVYFVATIIENYLFLTMLLSFFDVKVSNKQKLTYIFLVITIGKMTSIFIPPPYNIIINYTCMIILIFLIMKLKFLKSLTCLIITSFIFGLLNILIQNPYLTFLNISLETFMNTPKYRIPYLVILYSTLYLIIILLKKFRKLKIRLDLLDTLDRKTIFILCINLITGFFTLCLQLIVTTYYINILPLIITILNFLLLASFLILSIYSFTRMIELTITRKDLECAEEYNKSLKILYNKVNGFKHDFDAIISTINGYIEDNDMSGLKTYFKEVKKDCKITDNLALLNPNIINNPGIYSLLNNEYFKATKAGINFDISVFLNINELEINIYIFSRILGVLIDNAIESAEKCSEKIIKLSFIREEHNCRALITIENNYSNKDVDLKKIFEKGISSKTNPSGIGLWQVGKYIKKSKNLELKTSKNEKYFKQELFIYDI